MLWAPNPIATPTTPALASSGARLMPRSPRMTTLAIEKIVIDATLRKIDPRARTRCLRRSSTRARSASAAAPLISPWAASPADSDPTPRGPRRAVGEVRQQGVRRPLGQPVDHPVHDELDDEREQHHEDDAQQQVDRPVEELGRQL